MGIPRAAPLLRQQKQFRRGRNRSQNRTASDSTKSKSALADVRALLRRSLFGTVNSLGDGDLDVRLGRERKSGVHLRDFAINR
jgi:hypothetical protein